MNPTDYNVGTYIKCISSCVDLRDKLLSIENLIIACLFLSFLYDLTVETF